MDIFKFVNDAVKSVADEAAKTATNLAGAAIEAGEKAAEVAFSGAKAVADGASGAFNAASSTLVDVGGKAIDAAVAGGTTVVNAAQQAHHDLCMSFFNPVFPDEYKADDYDLPNMIVIVDGDQRKGIDVCNGAIGWLEKAEGMEILRLYEEAVEFSGLCFFPCVKTNAAYYIDPFDKKRFIDLDSYNEVIQKEKITELKNIAYSLGANECYLEAFEENRSRVHAERSAAVDVKSAGERVSGSFDQDCQSESLRKKMLVFKQQFEGSENPRRPELTWFKNDSEILSLIESRCSQENRIKEYSVQLSSASSSAMSVTNAAKIDSALKGMRIEMAASFKDEINQESQKSLVYHIKF